MGELHDRLVARAARWLRNTRGCAVVATEPVAFQANECPDAIGWLPSGASVVVECKTTLRDFYADRVKRCEREGNRSGMERWYLTPPGLIRAGVLMPPGWGLLELRPGDRVYCVYEATKIDPLNLPPACNELALLVAITRRALGGYARGVTVGES